jgi:protoporphyrinogen oxidase
MEKVDYLVVGAGVTGLSFANFLRHEVAARGRAAPDIAILEADHEPGGYCKTVVRDGFVWDYSGHFFHFKHPEIEAWLRARMPGQDIRTVEKRSFIRYAGRDIDFPFQKNIHQLPQEDFIDCLVELYFRGEGRGEGADAEAAPRSFQDMLYRRFGRGIAERFLIPYNEKLYACDLDRLDVDAMGRFFPHADIADIIRNMRRPDNRSYNAARRRDSVHPRAASRSARVDGRLRRAAPPPRSRPAGRPDQRARDRISPPDYLGALSAARRDERARARREPVFLEQGARVQPGL